MKFFLKAIVVVIFLIAAGAIAFYLYEQQQRAAFLGDLPGEIVFMRRDGRDISSIYKISANGQNEKLVFANDDKINANSMAPRWSEDGSRIRFSAMKSEKWSLFDVNSEGGDLKVSESKEGAPLHIFPLPDDLKIDKGSLFVKESDGRETLLYGFNSIIYDRVFAPGATNASWSPDRQYVIFETGYYAWGYIMIADRNGKNAVRLTDGSYPGWK